VERREDEPLGRIQEILIVAEDVKKEEQRRAGEKNITALPVKLDSRERKGYPFIRIAL
jgi:hypothetical protein